MQVRQAENVLLLLEYFAVRQQPATLAEVARHFGWPRSSTYNIINTLTDLGFLYEPRTRGSYYPSPKWLELSQAVADADPVPEPLVRIVARLAEETGETTWVTGRSGLYGVFLAAIESGAPVRYAARVGTRVPLHATASGQALMSQMTDREIDVILRRVNYVRYSENTPTSPEVVRAQIAAGRERGWFSSASNYSPDLGGVAVPVVDEGRVLAVTVAGPLFRVESKMDELARRLHRAVADEYGEGFVPRLLSRRAGVGKAGRGKA